MKAIMTTQKEICFCQLIGANFIEIGGAVYHKTKQFDRKYLSRFIDASFIEIVGDIYHSIFSSLFPNGLKCERE